LLFFYIVALKFGNILLISSTSCFTIIFTALLSPIVLGEKFRWKLDGVVIFLVALGSVSAVTQQPNIRENPTKDTVNGLVWGKLT